MALVSRQHGTLCARFLTAVIVFSLGTHFVEGDCRSKPGWKCRSTSSLFCSDGGRVEITDAYYLNPTDRTVCDEDCNATKEALSASQCRLIRTGCRQKVDQKELSRVYSACNARQSHCDLSSANRSVYVEYTCLDESEKINPCHHTQWRVTNASVIVLDDCSACNSTCKISPLGKANPFSFKYRFLQEGSPQPETDNIAEYKFVTSDESAPLPWTSLNTSSYTEFQDINELQNLQIRFRVSNPENITSLWISFYDLDVSIVCNATQPPVNSSSCADNSLETTVSTVVGTTSDSGNVTSVMSGFSFSAHSLAIGFAAGFLVAAVIFIVYIICRRRGRTYERSSPLRQRAQVTSYLGLSHASPARNVTSCASSRIYNEIVDSRRVTVNMDSEGYCHVPETSPPEGLAAQPGAISSSSAAPRNDTASTGPATSQTFPRPKLALLPGDYLRPTAPKPRAMTTSEPASGMPLQAPPAECCTPMKTSDQLSVLDAPPEAPPTQDDGYIYATSSGTDADAHADDYIDCLSPVSSGP
ncbi:hypothetical protein BaRGS_00020971 [Batillaria attramentaria]|uniref:Uncharacterized protein n=1 Tax=Batillaria attramentaria TaxID=370345 RepID=A0ABD0KKS8_9CAEN